MIKPSMGLVLKTAFLDSIREMVSVPLWWYTDGLTFTFAKLLGCVRGSVRYLGVDVWSKNLFVPMYGDDSVTGRAISFIVRLAVLVFRSLGLVLWLMVVCALAVLYVFILPATLIGLVLQIVGLILSYA